MTLHHAPRRTNQLAHPAPTAGVERPLPTARLLAAIRIAMGLVFTWAFLDKTFGIGYATPAANAWINGGSPTKGFLGSIDRGPLGDVFRSWAGQAWADWLFMAGLLGIGAALLLGVGLRVAAAAGSLQLLLMWAAEWPLARHTDAGELTRSTNPVLDYHIVYALVLVLLAVACAGDVWGLGRRWARLDLVDRNRWLR
ncbi:hypothetical protein [Actinokineospora sp. NPDC004072]